ncbi:MAG: valine--tRNA ligase, partial [Cyclobacteriaceae bacterium]
MSQEIAKTYNPKEIEEKWYACWEKYNFFHSEPDPEKESYTIVIPPPNVTGILHMGHMLNNTIQDTLIRRARMQGKEACWVPGTDHASIATETKVVNKLAEQGIDKKDITREQFLEHAWEWKEEYGGIILNQLKKLGASCDWERTKFTMDQDLSESVNQVFVDLFEKGYIYRGVRMVNWDPKGLTAISDEEVNHKEVTSKLCYLKYQVEGTNEFVIVATTRPETIFGDTAVCFHPEDERYAHLKGKNLVIPLVERAIPAIFDNYVDLEFGTGALKVTPAHDINDYQLGDKHKLQTIDVLNEDGTLNSYGLHYEGVNRFVTRKGVLKELEEKGLLEKIEEIQNSVGVSERTNEVIEPRLSMQWFCKMEELVTPALENVLNQNIAVTPPKFVNMYKSWLENIKDWCVSRQLWWGHRIPAYYLPSGEYVVALTEDEAVAKAQKIDASLKLADLKQDEDVLDTWFSSWLWPIAVFDGIRNPDNEEINYYYPTQVVVSGFDIIFFWIARMVMAGYEFKGELPFKNIYITGMVRDPKGRKMSKSLGNSPDPLKLIEKYSADGVRVGMLLSAPAGNDLLFD